MCTHMASCSKHYPSNVEDNPSLLFVYDHLLTRYYMLYNYMPGNMLIQVTVVETKGRLAEQSQDP